MSPSMGMPGLSFALFFHSWPTVWNLVEPTIRLPVEPHVELPVLAPFHMGLCSCL